MQDGTVDVETLEEDELEILLEETERRAAAYKRSKADRKRKTVALKPPTRPTLQGKKVFIEPDVQVGEAKLRELQRIDKWLKVGCAS